MSINRSLMRI